MFKQSKKMSVIALASFLGLGAIASGVALGAKGDYGINAEEKDYTIGASGGAMSFTRIQNENYQGYSNKYRYVANLKTSLGNDIAFRVNGSDKVTTNTAPEVEIFRLGNQTYFYNETPLSGIKKITFTLSDYIKDPSGGKVSVYFGYGSVDAQKQSYSFKAVKNQKYEVTFDSIRPSTFGFNVTCEMGFKDFEVTYTCEETKYIGKDVTVNNEKELTEALAYHSHFEDSASIVLGQDIELENSLYFYGEGAAKTYRINTNGHALKAVPASQSGTSLFDDARTEISKTDTSRPILNIRENANIVINGNGGIYANGADASIADMGGGQASESSSLTINGGTFVSGFDTMNLYINGSATKNAGNITINGGTFKNEGGGHDYLLNIQDSTAVGTFIVSGGEFYNFNPVKGDFGRPADSTENRLTFVNGDLYEVTSEEVGEDTVYSVVPKTGALTLTKDTVLTKKMNYATSAEVSIDGQGHTLSLAEGYSKDNNYVISGKGKLSLTNMTIDMENAPGIWGVEFRAEAYMENVKMINIDRAGASFYTLNVYGGGIATFIDCDIEPAKNRNAAPWYDGIDIWLGDGRTTTFKGGSYGSIIANTSNGGGCLHSSKVIIDASEEHPTTIAELNLAGEFNSMAVMCDGVRYEAKQAYSAATVEGNDSEFASVKVVTNPDGYDISTATNLTGKTITKAE